MIDLFALGLTHALLALAGWRLLMRTDLDREPVAEVTPAHEASEQATAGAQRRKARRD